MNKRLSLDDYKKEYINKSFGWLNVINVTKESDSNNHNKIYFICKCKCGNIKSIRKDHVLAGNIISCGCYHSSEEFKNNRKKFYREHREVVESQAEKHKQWFKDNPDKVKEIGDKHSKWLKLNINNTKIKQDKVNISELKKEYIGKTFNWLTILDVIRESKNNYKCIYFRCQCKCGNITLVPKKHILNNKVKSCGCYKFSNEFYAYRSMLKSKRGFSHKVNLSNRFKLHYKNNHNHKLKISKSLKNYYNNIHTNGMYNYITEYSDIIHPDDFSKLLSQTIHTIRLKCPECNNFAEHRFANVFLIKKQQLKYGHIPLCANCYKQLKSSHYEDEIEEFIKSFYNGEIARNTRDIISPLELDIYIPEKKIAIEFNGDYWHSEKFMDKEYHYNKYKLCKEKGILLVSIFESEWNKNKYSIKEYIKDLLIGKENDLSYNEDKSLMNNNYPSLKVYKDVCTLVEHYYLFNNVKVYTCGYSKLI